MALNRAVMIIDVRAKNPTLSKKSKMTVLALPDGGALVSNNTVAIRLSHTGSIITTLYMTETYITGFIYLSPEHVLILQKTGVITKVSLQDGKKLDQYKVNVESLVDGIAVQDFLLLVDYHGGQIVRFGLLHKTKQILVRGLERPTSVGRTVQDGKIVYLVCEYNTNRVILYDSKWNLKKSFGQLLLRNPESVLILPSNTILVTDSDNHRVTEFTLDGRYCRHVLNKADGIETPIRISFGFPNLWVSYGRVFWEFNVKCFQIYQPNEK